MQNQTYGNPSASFISPDVQNTVYVAQLEKMSLLSLILLSIVTLGLYGLYYPIRECKIVCVKGLYKSTSVLAY